MHTGCPVIKGIKWGAPVWIHVDEFFPEAYNQIEAQAKAMTPEQRMRVGLRLSLVVLSSPPSASGPPFCPS